MLRAAFFDIGGTLDGDGHWLDRFVESSAPVGPSLSPDNRQFEALERHGVTFGGWSADSLHMGQVGD